MRNKLVLFIVVAAAGCATGSAPARVDESRLVRLSETSRQQLIDAERPVRVAESNLEAAQVALKEAKQFESIVDSERKAAHDRREAAKKSVALGKSSGYTDGKGEDLQDAEARVAAYDAKKKWAHQIVDQRGALVEQRRAELDAARAELEAHKVAMLAEEGQSSGLDRARFDRAAAGARRRASELAAHAERKNADARARRTSWQALSRQAGEPDSTTSEPPPPPEPLVR